MGDSSMRDLTQSEERGERGRERESAMAAQRGKASERQACTRELDQTRESDYPRISRLSTLALLPLRRLSRLVGHCRVRRGILI
jgi:hypothetical protein